MIIITTSYEANHNTISRAKAIAENVGGVFIHRSKESVNHLMKKHKSDELIVVDSLQAKYYALGMEKPFFFHPSMAALRINRLKQGDNDIMVQISGLREGDSFLDCTLGLGADSIVASYVVGSTGKVVGVESQPILAALMRDGLRYRSQEDEDLNAAMRRIEVIANNHYQALRELPENSFDVVYFDPMFRVGLPKSEAINPLRMLANPNPLTLEAIQEAKRVAKRKVLLKEDKRSKEFERLGFKKIPRSSNIVFGVIALGDDKK